MYDKKTYFWALLGLSLMIPLQMFTQGAGFVIAIPFVLMALIMDKTEQIVYWTLVSITIMMGNKVLLPVGPVFFLTQRSLLTLVGIVLTFKAISGRRAVETSPFLGILVYLLYMAVVSAYGWAPLISLLKIFLFLVIFFAYFGAASQIATAPRQNGSKIRAMILAMATFFIVGSLLLIPFPAISQITGEEYRAAILAGENRVSLFKGISMHSQALGPLISFIFLFLFADFTFSIRRMDKLYIFLMLCCPYLVYKTSSRAAMATFIAGTLGVGILLMYNQGVGLRWRSRIKKGLVVIIGLILIAGLSSSSFRDTVSRLALKYDTDARASDFTMEQAMSTRQGLMDRQMENFHRSPIVGNGFQVYEGFKNIRVNSWKDILSAPVEKGVWVTAVLEEGGVLGAIIIWAFVFITGISLLRCKAYIGLTMFGAVLVSNMAEFTMFSMSSIGGFVWALVLLGCSLDAIRKKQDRMFVQYQPYDPRS